MRKSETVVDRDADPTGREWWFGYVALIAPALLLLVSKGEQAEATDSSLPTQVLWTIAYLSAGRSLWAHRQAFVNLVKRSPVLWLFVFMLLGSTLWSVDPLVSFKNGIELIGTTIIASYFVVRYRLPRFLHLVGCAYGTIAVLSLITIVVAPGRGRDDWGSGPLCGVYQDKNNLGAAMAMTILAIAMTLLTPDGRRSVIRWLTGLLGLVLLLGSSSVTALSSCIVAMTIGTGALAGRSPRYGHIATVVMLAVAAVAGSAFALGGISPDSLTGLLGRSSTLTGRTDFWPYVLEAIGDRPLFGYGYKAFFRSPEGHDYLSYYVVEAGGWTPYHAHNTFLQISLDIGLVGLGILIVLVLIGLYRGVRYFAQEPGPSAAWPIMVVIYILVGSNTETYLANFNSFEWIFFVAALQYPIRSWALRPAPERKRYAFTPRSASPAPAASSAVATPPLPVRGRVGNERVAVLSRR